MFDLNEVIGQAICTGSPFLTTARTVMVTRCARQSWVYFDRNTHRSAKWLCGTPVESAGSDMCKSHGIGASVHKRVSYVA